MELTSALALIDGIVRNIKHVRDAAQKLQDAEIKNAIADILNNSADLKIQLAELRDENISLREERDALRKQQEFRSKLVMRDALYYAQEPIAGYGDGPFCPACMDSKKMLTTLFPVYRPNGGSEIFRYDCRVCRVSFLLPEA